MHVFSILNRKGDQVMITSPSTPVAEVVGAFKANKGGALVVTSHGKIKGILTESEIVAGLAERGLEVLSSPVSSLMIQVTVRCRRADTIARVIQKMIKGDTRHVPVVEAGRLVGIVSMSDVIDGQALEAEANSALMRECVSSGHMSQPWPHLKAGHC
ncbi:putative CBS domain-containing protein [uncultured Gammaproteobacteria bacterium]